MEMADYYDKLLAAIAASLVGGTALGALGPVALEAGILVGALTATAFVYEALFRNPPEPMTTPRQATLAVAWHVFLLALAFAVLA